MNARWAWLWYFLMRLSDVFCMVFIHFIIIGSSTSTTLVNIQNSNWLFGLNIAGNLFSQFCFIFLTLALNNIFKKENSKLSKLMLILAMVGVLISILNTLILVAIQLTVSQFGCLKSFNENQVNIIAFKLLNLYENGLIFVKIFWALCIIPLGILMFKSKYFHSIIGRLMLITSFIYLANCLLSFFDVISYHYSIDILIFTTIGELFIVSWFLFNSPKTQFQY